MESAWHERYETCTGNTSSLRTACCMMASIAIASSCCLCPSLHFTVKYVIFENILMHYHSQKGMSNIRQKNISYLPIEWKAQVHPTVKKIITSLLHGLSLPNIFQVISLKANGASLNKLRSSCYALAEALGQLTIESMTSAYDVTDVNFKRSTAPDWKRSRRSFVRECSVLLASHCVRETVQFMASHSCVMKTEKRFAVTSIFLQARSQKCSLFRERQQVLAFFFF